MPVASEPCSGASSAEFEGGRARIVLVVDGCVVLCDGGRSGLGLLHQDEDAAARAAGVRGTNRCVPVGGCLPGVRNGGQGFEFG